MCWTSTEPCLRAGSGVCSAQKSLPSPRLQSQRSPFASHSTTWMKKPQGGRRVPCTDKQLTCQDCGTEFTFSAEDQEFFAQKGYTNEPRRCPTCRQARRSSRGGGGSYGGGGGARTMYPAVCATCGTQTELPFQPRGDRPVYCRDCFAKTREAYR